MALPLISRENAIARLKDMGCSLVDEQFDDHTVWKTPWGRHFFCPHPPPEGMLSEFDFNRLVARIFATKPTTH